MARGLDAERRTAGVLRAAGHLVASRRHEAGPGDLLAWTPNVPLNGGRRLVDVPPLLIEVKHTLQPFGHFGGVDRRDMLQAAEDYGVEPILAWWPPGSRILIWIPPEEWPRTD